MNDKLNAAYWSEHYQSNHIPWDIGYASPPLIHFLEKVQDKNSRILIPGAGRAHEAIYLHKNGFTNVFVCDWAKEAFEYLDEQCPDFPEEHKLIGDFFQLDIKVDFIIEQTFFCAINPELRSAYAKKVADLLVDGGILAGVLFSQPFEMQGPPYGGTKEEYKTYFEPYFEILSMENSEQSIKPRYGSELFIELKRL